MTTIACSRHEMACDSRSSMDTEFFTCGDKVVRIGECLVGCAGSYSAIFKFLAWFERQTQDRPEFEDGSFTALVLDARGIRLFSDSTYGGWVTDKFIGIGTGGMAAKAAMLCGKSPAEAVAVAIKCDKSSGGPVRSFSLKVKS